MYLRLYNLEFGLVTLHNYYFFLIHITQFFFIDITWHSDIHHSPRYNVKLIILFHHIFYLYSYYFIIIHIKLHVYVKQYITFMRYHKIDGQND